MVAVFAGDTVGRAIVGVSVALVVIVVGFLATCVIVRTAELDAELSAPFGPDAGPYWHMGTRSLHYSFGGLGGNLHVARPRVAINVPEARHSFPLSRPLSGDTTVLTAYVLPSGDFLCRGIVAPLATGAFPDRESLLAEVRRAFGETPLRRMVEEGTLSQICLGFDLDTYWRYASALLEVLAEHDLRSTPILLIVAYPPIGEWCALRCRFRRGEVPDPAARGYLDVRLLGAVPLEGESAVQIGKRRWEIPHNPWYVNYGTSLEERRSDLETANAIWAEIDEHIGPLARRHDGVRIHTASIDRRLAVRYVITLLDILIGHGIRSVEFPDAAVVLDFEIPPPGLKHLAPRKPVGMPLVRGPLVILTLVGIAAAIWVSLTATRPSTGEARIRRRV